MSTQRERCRHFRDLHDPGKFVVLPNAWDAASARVFEDAGASAIATSSASLAWSHGYADGEALPTEVALSAIAEILRVVKVPVSVDSEAGYSSKPKHVADFIVALVNEGAVGINLEDASDPPELLADKIAAIKQAVKAAGGDVFVNARTDVYLRKLTSPETALAETLARGARYRDAGADGFFVPSLYDLRALKTVAAEIGLPLNVVTISPATPPASHLKEAGVRRLSAGARTATAALGAARRAVLQLLNEGVCGRLFAESEGLPNLNTLLTRGY